MKRRFLVRLCEYLERKLYAEPTYEEMAKTLDQTRFLLADAKLEIDCLQKLIRQFTKNTV